MNPGGAVGCIIYELITLFDSTPRPGDARNSASVSNSNPTPTPTPSPLTNIGPSIGGSNIHITHGHTVSSQIPASILFSSSSLRSGSTVLLLASQCPWLSRTGAFQTVISICLQNRKKGRGGSNSALNILEPDCYEKHIIIHHV